jgi:hypothetical protein
MTTTALLGIGTATSVGSTIAQVRNLKGPGLDRAAINITNNGSTVQEFLPGVLDPGKASFELIYSSGGANFSSVFGGITGGTVQSTSFTFSDGSALAGSAFFTKVDVKEETLNVIMADCELKMTGAWTFTAG